MRIEALRVVRIGGALPRPIAGARAAWPRRDGLLVEVIGADGCSGWGEATPLPGYSPDDVEACSRALEVVRHRLTELPDDAPAPEAVAQALEPFGVDLARAPAARFALETALLDGIGKRTGRSIAELLAGPGRLAAVPRSGLLRSAGSGADLRAEARALAARGVGTAKTKIGGSFEVELAALCELRRSAPDLGLRLDANGAWSASEARANIERLAPLCPVWIEEPAAGEALVALGRAAVGWAADESLAAVEPRRLLDAPGCVAAVLKPALLGGLLAARAIGREAIARGHAVVVTHLFDGPIALAAACELALSLPVAPSGLDPHQGLAAFETLAIPQLDPDPGWIRPSGRPGHGVQPGEVRS